MFSLGTYLRIFLCSQPTDMRKSYDGLAGAVSSILGHDPLSGHLFVFFNRRRTMVKMLLWDRSGFCMFCKRLEAGQFVFSFNQICAEIDAATLLMVFKTKSERQGRSRRQMLSRHSRRSAYIEIMH